MSMITDKIDGKIDYTLPTISIWYVIWSTLWKPIPVAMFYLFQLIILWAGWTVLVVPRMLYLTIRYGRRTETTIGEHIYAFTRTYWHLHEYAVANSTSHLFYPIYFYNREWINSKVYAHISEKESIGVIEADLSQSDMEISERPDIYKLKRLMQKESKLAYFLWTYGDTDLPSEESCRWMNMPYMSYDALYRWAVDINGRFNYLYMDMTWYRKEKLVIVDTKSAEEIAVYGIAGVKPGSKIYLYRVIDKDGKIKPLYFYEDVFPSAKMLLYLGGVPGWRHEDISGLVRFEGAKRTLNDGPK